MDETTITAVGTMLEEKGMSHEDIDTYFLEHFGVKGMKWGVRNSQRRMAARHQVRVVDPIRRTAAGQGTARDRRVAGRTTRTLVDVARGRSVQETSQRSLARAQDFQASIQRGERRTQDLLLRFNGTNVRDLNFAATGAPNAPTNRRERAAAVRTRARELSTAGD